MILSKNIGLDKNIKGFRKEKWQLGLPPFNLLANGAKAQPIYSEDPDKMRMQVSPKIRRVVKKREIQIMGSFINNKVYIQFKDKKGLHKAAHDNHRAIFLFHKRNRLKL